MGKCEVCDRPVDCMAWLRDGPVCGGAMDPEALAECYRLGYERAIAELAIWRDEDAREAKYEAVSRHCTKAEEALAAARRECEAGKADLATLLGFIRYIICPVCAADHVRIENGIIRGHPPMDRRAAGEGNRCTASRGSLLDVIRDVTARAALAAPAAGEEGK